MQNKLQLVLVGCGVSTELVVAQLENGSQFEPLLANKKSPAALTAAVAAATLKVVEEEESVKIVTDSPLVTVEVLNQVRNGDLFYDEVSAEFWSQTPIGGMVKIDLFVTEHGTVALRQDPAWAEDMLRDFLGRHAQLIDQVPMEFYVD